MPQPDDRSTHRRNKISPVSRSARAWFQVPARKDRGCEEEYPFRGTVVLAPPLQECAGRVSSSSRSTVDAVNSRRCRMTVHRLRSVLARTARANSPGRCAEPCGSVTTTVAILRQPLQQRFNSARRERKKSVEHDVIGRSAGSVCAAASRALRSAKPRSARVASTSSNTSARSFATTRAARSRRNFFHQRRKCAMESREYRRGGEGRRP